MLSRQKGKRGASPHLFRTLVCLTALHTGCAAQVMDRLPNEDKTLASTDGRMLMLVTYVPVKKTDARGRCWYSIPYTGKPPRDRDFINRFEQHAEPLFKHFKNEEGVNKYSLNRLREWATVTAYSLDAKKRKPFIDRIQATYSDYLSIEHQFVSRHPTLVAKTTEEKKVFSVVHTGFAELGKTSEYDLEEPCPSRNCLRSTETDPPMLAKFLFEEHRAAWPTCQ